MSESVVRISFGGPERFYDTDRHTTRIVCRRYEKWQDEQGQKWGRWDYVPWPPTVLRDREQT